MILVYFFILLHFSKLLKCIICRIGPKKVPAPTESHPTPALPSVMSFSIFPYLLRWDTYIRVLLSMNLTPKCPVAILSPNAYRAHLQIEPLGANSAAVQHARVSSQMNLQKINSSAILATFSASWSREHQRNKYKMTKIILTSIAHPDWILNCFWARITFFPVILCQLSMY